MMQEVIQARIEGLLQRIAAAASRGSRDPAAVTLMGASKTVDPERIALATDLGLLHVGENYVQEAATKFEDMASLRQSATWHMIGHLQTNKVRQALQLFDVIETVHSDRLAHRLDAVAGEMGKRVPVYLEVNMGSELSKTGVDPERLTELARAIAPCNNLQVVGLMAVPPFTPDPEGARPYFQKIKQLRDDLNQAQIFEYPVESLSMGMSHDFEIAVEEGATVVRLGSSIWGARPA